MIEPGRWSVLSIILILTAALLGLTTVADYGSSWDEQIRREAGEQKLAYYQHLFRGEFDQAREISSRKDKYPGFYDLNLALLRRISPFSDVTTGHAFSLLLGVITVLGAVRLATLLGTTRAGFLAGLVLLLTPSFYGHMFINPKDIPFAFGSVWSIYWIARWLRDWPAPGWKTIGFTGLSIGITLACRIGGLVLICYLGLFILLAWLAGARQKEEQVRYSLKPLLRQILPVAVVVMAGLVILAIYWPSMHANPFARTGETLGAVTQFDWTMPIFFEGQFVPAQDLPWYYILKMFLLKIPVGILALLFAGAGFGIKAISQRERLLPQPADLPRLLLWFAILFPLAYVIVRNSTLYNGIRHLLFLVPLIAVVAGMALDHILVLLSRTRKALRITAVTGMAGYALWIAVTCIRLHPYQYIYYNELAGGIQQGSQKYETDYWGTVYKELTEGLLRHLAEARPSFSHPYVVINMEHVTWLAQPYLPEESSLPIRLVRSQPDEDDYYMASTSWAANQYHKGDPVVEVSRMGVRLGVVKDRRNLSEKERAPVFQNEESE